MSTKQFQWLGKAAVDRREIVLAAAQDVFAAEGFYEADVQSIAKMTGIGKATIYKIFGSKVGIIDAMLQDTVAHLGVIMLGQLAGLKQPIERLREGAFQMLAFVEENRSLCMVLLRDALASDRVSENYTNFQDQMEQITAPIFIEARSLGYFQGMTNREALEVAMSMLIGLTYKWLLINGKKGGLLAEGLLAINVMAPPIETRQG